MGAIPGPEHRRPRRREPARHHRYAWGGITAELNIAKLLGKRAGVIATALRSRPVDGPGGKAPSSRKWWPTCSADRGERKSNRSSAPSCCAAGGGSAGARAAGRRRRARQGAAAGELALSRAGKRAHQLIDLGRRRVGRQSDGHGTADIADTDQVRRPRGVGRCWPGYRCRPAAAAPARQGTPCTAKLSTGMRSAGLPSTITSGSDHPATPSGGEQPVQQAAAGSIDTLRVFRAACPAPRLVQEAR